MIIMKNVLIIDDEQDFCQLVKGRLARKQMSLNCAHSLDEGVHKLEATHPDVLLLDNNLPDGLGWKQAGALQKQYPDMRIILLSAFDPLSYEETGVGLQFTRMSKPINFQELEQYLA
jgi:DNA-binding response OmpR family regulator